MESRYYIVRDAECPYFNSWQRKYPLGEYKLGRDPLAEQVLHNEIIRIRRKWREGREKQKTAA